MRWLRKPLVATPILWAIILGSEAVAGISLSKHLLGQRWMELQKHPAMFNHYVWIFTTMDYVAIALVTLCFCWLARRTWAGLGQLTVACAFCSLCCLVFYARIHPHLFTFGLSTGLNSDLAEKAMIPWLIAGLACLRHRFNQWRWRGKSLASMVTA